MSKVLVSGYYGFENFGDEAILSFICSHLKSINADVTVLSASPSITAKKNGVKSFNSFDIKVLFREISGCDILLSGGGSLLQDVTSLKSLIYYSFVIFLALLFRKKIIIFAQGIGPLNSVIARFLVFNLLRHCSVVTVRDDKSFELLKSKGINSIKLSDPLFSLNIKNVEKSDTIGIQLRDFKGITDEFLLMLADSVSTEFTDKDIELISLQDSIDIRVLEKLQAKLKDMGIYAKIIKGLSQQEIINKITSLDKLIAMRFHAVLIAVKSNVKTLAVNYDEKVQKLAEEFQIPLINLNDYTNLSEQIKNLKDINIKKYSFPTFDWTEIDKILN